MSLPFILSEKQLTIILPNGTPKAVNSTSKYFDSIVEAIKKQDFDEVIKLIDLESQIKTFFATEGVEVLNGIIYVDGEELPGVLSNRVLNFIEQSLPYEPLINFWNNLKNNPSMNSVEELYGCLEHNHHPITPDGCFIAYKAITGDYLDKHTQKISNKIGETVKVARNKVDDNKFVTCSHGLHVASFDYAKNFMANYGDRLVVVKVNPEHVVSVPVDYNDQKLRVCQYEVISELENDKIKPIEDELFEEDEDDVWDEKEDDDFYDD